MATSTTHANNTHNPKSKTSKPKRAPLPQNARIQKRPLLRPPLPSPYTSAQSAKTIYLSARTPFLSAVKRCEKLLNLSEKRLVQAATVVAKNDRRRRDRDDEIKGIADAAERMKRKGDGGEEVVLKASGKAIGKGLEVGCWFQERGEMYNVRLQTGSVGVVDGIEYDEGDRGIDGETKKMANEEELPEARIRTISVLEVYVSLK